MTLKLDTQYFDDVLNGKKTFEIRFNDRGFMEGDEMKHFELTKRKVNNGKDDTNTRMGVKPDEGAT